MKLRKPLFILANSLVLVVPGLAHTSSEPKGIMGQCSEGLCHTIADWLGHGVFGLGWFGFILGLIVWIVLMFGVLHEARKVFAEHHSSE